MKRIRSILVGTDFSGAADNAAVRAARTAADHGAALQILHVMSEPAASRSCGMPIRPQQRSSGPSAPS